MELPLYQILIPGFCLLMIAKAFSHFLRHERTLRELLALILVWGAVGLGALFPSATSFLAGILGIKSNVNAILFTAIGFLCYLSFSLFISVENLEHVVTRLTREIALRDGEENAHQQKK